MKTNDHIIRDLFNKLRGIPVELNLKKYRQQLQEISSYDLSQKSDSYLQDMAADIKARAEAGISLNGLLMEAFALVREASHRTIGLKPFDVQVLAGIAMFQGKLIEMQTGEGKTLAAVLPAYLKALTGCGVHVLTFNDYLARRDAAWMGPIYKFLGLSVGIIQEDRSIDERKQAYAADITYATAKEAGFDYLRDHLCYDPQDLVHRPFHFAIVDEADSLLIDEARIPLVIAGMMDKPELESFNLAEVIKGLRPEIDFKTDEGMRNVFLTDKGIKHVEIMLGCGSLHTQENLDLLTSLNLALHAEILLQRDIDYIVRNGRIEIVDEFTGRVVEDRHWPDGLQAAVESKEKLRLREGGSILGSITLQHFFQLYPQICGMTATAYSAADEFHSFYNLKLVVVPPNLPCIRNDESDVIFATNLDKTKALIQEISNAHKLGRPVLVGTASVEESEELAGSLSQAGLNCQVLNAKNDEKEAKIIAQAGKLGAITISTNMAGRGTDIKLGGDQELQKDAVVALGGLYVIGTNLHESVRIDRQLQGRAGRQGDPGSSRFFVCLEDSLFQRYKLDQSIPKRFLKPTPQGVLENPFVSRQIAHGQRIIEGVNYDIRKTLWKYSSQVEFHRNTIQKWRHDVLMGKVLPNLLEAKAPERFVAIRSQFGREELQKIEKQLTLCHIDRFWSEHLAMIADVRESIHLVSVGGESPMNEFLRIVVDEFLVLKQKINEDIVTKFLSLKIAEAGMDLDQEGLRGPSSTWTYLVNDNQFGTWVEMLKGSNIGFSAGAAAWYPYLYILLGLVRQRSKKKNS